MRFLTTLVVLLAAASATILQNGQVRDNPYPGQATLLRPAQLSSGWRAYNNNASVLSTAYKGRWDHQYISWWSAPGMKLGFTGTDLAIEFGRWTSDGVLLAWRLDGLDWNFANVTSNATYQFISASTPGQNLTVAGQSQTFEFRVSNYAYGVQVNKVLVAKGESISKLPVPPLMIEMIGDSLTAGYSATYEGISSFGWGLCEGLGNVEFSITAYPGICVHDQYCFGSYRGQTYQWLQTPDTSHRAQVIYGNSSVPWKFNQHPRADLVVINLGTNDSNDLNGAVVVSDAEYTASMIELIEKVHARYPKAQIIVMQIWQGFYRNGSSWYQTFTYDQATLETVAHFQTDAGTNFVHYFNTTGILQHNDMNFAALPHPTDVGHVKVASHLMQYIKLTFGWNFAATGPEVQHGTTYWNNEVDY